MHESSCKLNTLKSIAEDALLFFLYFILFFNFTILYWFAIYQHESATGIHTRVPHPEPSFLLPPCTIPQGHPSAPAPSIQYRASNVDWRLVSYMLLYMFQCHSPNSPYPFPLPGCIVFVSYHPKFSLAPGLSKNTQTKK